MDWIDGHLDLAMLAVLGDDPANEADGVRRCVSLPALRRSSVDIVLGTIFTEMVPGAPGDAVQYSAGDRESAHAAGLRQLAWYESMEQRGELSIVRCQEDLNRGAFPRVVLLMECADPIRTPDEVAWWHDRGVRVVGLSWARGSRYSGGNARHGGLTPVGRDMVDALDAFGILHDASHLCDRSLDDLLAHTPRAVVATHMNLRSQSGSPTNQRHLRNDHLLSIAARGGVAGLVLYRGFLTAAPEATIADVVRHAGAVRSIAGVGAVTLGSDLDGGFLPRDVPEGLRGPEEYGALAAALSTAGWSPEEVAAVQRDNWLRVLRDALPG
ncbi:MAG: membrane dipeptidase [Planctomycetota bacterium]|nr:membrane dipeptidase [Planctomycetota bacterium]MDA1105989.1 membrane dipeptidase [Planctomycetota bacterium]